MDTGRILASDDGTHWTVLRLPALAEGEDDPLGRAEGEALCPARYDERALARIKRVMGDYTFAALYQGCPQPREGHVIPVQCLEIVPAVPREGRRVRYWDKAATAGSGDYSAGVLMACSAFSVARTTL